MTIDSIATRTIALCIGLGLLLTVTACGDDTSDPMPSFVCGNATCEAGETADNCPADCGTSTTCGNRVCEAGETAGNCAVDCSAAGVCGDGSCGLMESSMSCPADCETPVTCGNGLCDIGENCGTCAGDCGACMDTCGNAVCDAAETCEVCPGDCGECATCGNGVCGADEDCTTCAADSGQCPTCGNGVCDMTETCGSCEADCGACPMCGDGLCNGDETCASCEGDCGACPALCGDGSCGADESPLTCSVDCPCFRTDQCAQGDVCTPFGSCAPAWGRTYRITAGEFSLSPTTSTGESWDLGGGAPDPFARFYVNGSLQGSSATIDDSFVGAFDTYIDVTFNDDGTSVIAVELWDADAAVSDFGIAVSGTTTEWLNLLRLGGSYTAETNAGTFVVRIDAL